jgi:hypothetical protein
MMKHEKGSIWFDLRESQLVLYLLFHLFALPLKAIIISQYTEIR